MRAILRPVSRGRRWAAKARPALLVILVLSILLASCSDAEGASASWRRLRIQARDAAKRFAASFERWSQPLVRELRGLGEAVAEVFGGFAEPR